MKKLLFCAILILNVVIYSQTFTDIGLDMVYTKSYAWGDYDNDCDLDILSGSYIYRNDSGTFINVPSGIPNSTTGSARWGDYDNDGDLDILLENKLYRNDNGIFSFYKYFDFYSQCGYPIHDTICKTDFVDVNSDGFLDIFLTGQYNFYPDPDDPFNILRDYITYIYYNDGGNGFKESQPKEFSSEMYENFTWSDFDNDGVPDLLITGEKSGGPTVGGDYFDNATVLYRNNLNNNFSLITDTFPDIEGGSADWGDFDNDGFSDIVISGNTSAGTVLQIHRNNKDSTFTDIYAGLPGFDYSSVEWGDYDNDGYLDIVVKGISEGLYKSIVIHNQNGLSFEISDYLASSSAYECSWGDYDNDGDLDLIAGSIIYRNENDSTKVQKNKSANNPPLPPSGLISVVNGASVIFTWDKSTDTETPQNGLSYNIYVSSSSAICDIASPMSDIDNGYRRIVKVGNAGQSPSKTLRSLPNGTYYWSVQAIDHGYAGSEFGTEQTVIVTGIEDNIPLTTELYQNYPNPFNPATEIKFSLADDSKVNLSVYNTKGQLVRTLIDGKTEKGYHTVNFLAEGLNSGVYFCRLDVGGSVKNMKMLLVK
ncbi:MAG: FG-GAP-like repeat-containing protein [Candidatus Delongbacteria bacterium]